MSVVYPNKQSFSLRDYFDHGAIQRDGYFTVLDKVDTTFPDALVYCQNLFHLQKARANLNVAAIICPLALADEATGVSAAIVLDDNPRRLFFQLYVKMSEAGYLAPTFESGVGSNCSVHPSAVVSPRARLGNAVRIGANVVVEDNCFVGNHVEIGPNAVIGAEGLITLRNSDGSLLRVKHAGGVEIGEGSQILAGAVIAKSLFRTPTRIGLNCQIGILSNVGHGVCVGDGSVVSGNSVVAGLTRLGRKVWVGTSASIAQGLVVGEGAQIKMGAVVVRDVGNGEVVSGNFAVSHRTNVARYLKSN